MGSHCFRNAWTTSHLLGMGGSRSSGGSSCYSSLRLSDRARLRASSDSPSAPHRGSRFQSVQSERRAGVAHTDFRAIARKLATLDRNRSRIRAGSRRSAWISSRSSWAAPRRLPGARHRWDLQVRRTAPRWLTYPGPDVVEKTMAVTQRSRSELQALALRPGDFDGDLHRRSPVAA
jgi:hypothetical protein